MPTRDDYLPYPASAALGDVEVRKIILTNAAPKVTLTAADFSKYIEVSGSLGMTARGVILPAATNQIAGKELTICNNSKSGGEGHSLYIFHQTDDEILASSTTLDHIKITYGAAATFLCAADGEWTVTSTSLISSDGADQVRDASVTSAKIAQGAVTTPKLAAAVVTAAKLADDAITADAISDSAVTAAAIAAGSVTTAKIAAGTDGTDDNKILVYDDSAAAAWAKLQVKNIQSTNVAAHNQVATFDSATGGVTWTGAAGLGDGSVTTAKIAAAAVTTAKIADGAVTLSKIADSAAVADRNKLFSLDNAGDPALTKITSRHLAPTPRVEKKFTGTLTNFISITEPDFGKYVSIQPQPPPTESRSSAQRRVVLPAGTADLLGRPIWIANEYFTIAGLPVRVHYESGDIILGAGLFDYIFVIYNQVICFQLVQYAATGSVWAIIGQAEIGGATVQDPPPLSAVANDNQLLVTEDSASGAPTRTVTAGVLKTFTDFDLHDDVTTAAAAVADDDRFLVTDESESDDPHRFLSFQKLKSAIAPSIMAQSQVGRVAWAKIDGFADWYLFASGAHAKIGERHDSRMRMFGGAHQIQYVVGESLITLLAAAPGALANDQCYIKSDGAMVLKSQNYFDRLKSFVHIGDRVGIRHGTISITAAADDVAHSIGYATAITLDEIGRTITIERDSLSQTDSLPAGAHYQIFAERAPVVVVNSGTQHLIEIDISALIAFNRFAGSTGCDVGLQYATRPLDNSANWSEWKNASGYSSSEYSAFEYQPDLVADRTYSYVEFDDRALSSRLLSISRAKMGANSDNELDGAGGGDGWTDHPMRIHHAFYAGDGAGAAGQQNAFILPLQYKFRPVIAPGYTSRDNTYGFGSMYQYSYSHRATRVS